MTMAEMKTKDAFLLAAGFGVRLKPITITTPKPLLTLGRGLLIDHQLMYLKKNGIKDVVINLHHLGDKIKSHVGDGARFGLAVRYSEEPEILGTGGGMAKAAKIIDRTPFIALNCDAIMVQDFTPVIRRHVEKEASATMVIRKAPPGEDFTGIDIDRDGNITAIGRGGYVFTGLQIIDQGMLDALPPSGPSCIVADGYKKLLKDGLHISSYIYDGYWNDIGTKERYEKVLKDIETGVFSPLYMT
jgi:NDP-sugar pyrophosphorylase family protein